MRKLILIFAAAVALLAQRGGGGGSGSSVIACVGTPGNTLGSYRQQCQTTGGAIWACNNAAGCTTSADWVAVASGGATIPATTNVLKGDGAGNAADTKVAITAPATAATIQFAADNETVILPAGTLVPNSRTVNGHALSGNVTVTPTDLSLVIGTNTEAWSANLDAWSAIATSSKAASNAATTVNGQSCALGGTCTITTSVTHTISLNIDGGGSTIATGNTNLYLTVPDTAQGGFSCTIVGASIAADQSGSITVDVWKANDAIPTGSDKISASAPVTLSSAQKNLNSALTSWTTSVVPKDIFGFSVATAVTVTKAQVTIWCQKIP